MMKYKYLFGLFIGVLLTGCANTHPRKPSFRTDFYLSGIIVRMDTLTWVDSLRGRKVPVTIYNRMHLSHDTKQKLVILNPGYGGTRNDYSYIAVNLANKGYLVVTIQHNLPKYDSLPRNGESYKLNKPFLDNGVKSIFFVTEKLKARNPGLDYDDIALIGPSDGGDMAMLVAGEYPQFAKVVITLDNCSVPIRRVNHPKILSIRSANQPADSGVLPSAEEEKKYGIKIIKVNTPHNDMGGKGTEAQKQEINNYIIDFLNGNL